MLTGANVSARWRGTHDPADPCNFVSLTSPSTETVNFNPRYQLAHLNEL